MDGKPVSEEVPPRPGAARRATGALLFQPFTGGAKQPAKEGRRGEAMNTDPKPSYMPPDQGCASCRILWDAEVERRNLARRCLKASPLLGIQPVYTSPRVALCGMCLYRMHKFWIATGEQPTCPHEARALALYLASRRWPHDSQAA